MSDHYFKDQLYPLNLITAENFKILTRESLHGFDNSLYGMLAAKGAKAPEQRATNNEQRVHHRLRLQNTDHRLPITDHRPLKKRL